jgi:hypothetical protein
MNIWDILKFGFTLLGFAGGALSIYITVRLAPLLLRMTKIEGEIDRIDKDRAEEDKRLRARIEQEAADREKTDTKIESYRNSLPNCDAHMASVKQQVEAFKGEIRLEVIEKLTRVTEANAKFREELRKDVSGHTEAWTREGITREAVEKIVRDFREDVQRDIRRIEDKVDGRR